MIVYLRIRSCRSLGIGRHYYGELRCGDKRVDVLRRLSAAEALTVRQQTGFSSYREGSQYSAFHLKSDVISKALEIWRDKFPEGALLISGDPIYTEPQEILDGPPELMAELNAIYEHCEELGWWDGDYVDEVHQASAEWDHIIEEATCEPEIK